MGSLVKMTILGGDNVARALKKYDAQRLQKAIGAATYNLGSIVLTQAQVNAPIDTGTLRASAYCTMPKGSGVKTSVTIGFGGAAKAYARAQHENTTWHHTEGMAKYLDVAVDQYRSRFTEIWTRHFRLALDSNNPSLVGAFPPTESGSAKKGLGSKGKGGKRKGGAKRARRRGGK